MAKNVQEVIIVILFRVTFLNYQTYKYEGGLNLLNGKQRNNSWLNYHSAHFYS